MTTFEVHFSVNGQYCTVTIQAQSSWSAQVIVKSTYPGAVIATVRQM